jgi:hypothetical protein
MPEKDTVAMFLIQLENGGCVHSMTKLSLALIGLVVMAISCQKRDDEHNMQSLRFIPSYAKTEPAKVDLTPFRGQSFIINQETEYILIKDRNSHLIYLFYSFRTNVAREEMEVDLIQFYKSRGYQYREMSSRRGFPEWGISFSRDKSPESVQIVAAEESSTYQATIIGTTPIP